ncbi:hypothetical protein D1872_308280 [compost metagenome]
MPLYPLRLTSVHSVGLKLNPYFSPYSGSRLRAVVKMVPLEPVLAIQFWTCGVTFLKIRAMSRRRYVKSTLPV